MNETSAVTRTDAIEARILEVLSSIRPAIRADGGDIELVEFDERTGRVDIRMVGACYACPMSMLTLKAGIVQRLRLIVPEAQRVDTVDTLLIRGGGGQPGSRVDPPMKRALKLADEQVGRAVELPARGAEVVVHRVHLAVVDQVAALRAGVALRSGDRG